MIDTFQSGYLEAILDIYEQMRQAESLFPCSKKAQLAYLTSLVEYLTQHKEERDLFRDYGGHIWKKISKDGTVLAMAKDKKDLRKENDGTKLV